MITSNEVVNFIKEAELSELGEVAAALADSAFKWRIAHEGKVPPEVFTPFITIGGSYPCYEIIVAITDREGRHQGYAVKKRGVGEQGWQGLFHITGTSGYFGISPEKILARLTVEIFGVHHQPLKSQDLKVAGVTVAYESDRLADAHTLCWVLEVPSENFNIQHLSGIWKVLALDKVNDPSLNLEHRQTLSRLISNLRDGKLDSRPVDVVRTVFEYSA